jgi:excisionase family DNA binding protein
MNRVNRKRSNADTGELPNSMELVRKLESGSSALRARDLAQLFGVTQQHIYKLAAQGVIPSFRVGTAVRFDPATVAEWLRRKISPGRVAMAAARIAV